MPPRQTRRVLLLGIVAALTALRGRLGHVVVAGSSMRPTLEPGDRLVTLRPPWGPRVGGLVLAPDPRRAERMLIKRVHALGGDLVELRGDAPAHSTDSRTFGAVPVRTVEPCVAFRYHPIARAGPVSSARAGAARRGCR